MQTHAVIPGFWQYLGAFTGYTLFAIGLIYASFFYLKRNPRLLAAIGKTATGKGLGNGILANLPFARPGKLATVQSESAFQIESTLPLEMRKNLYVIRCGQERFLLASCAEGIQLLSRLDSQDLQNPQAQESQPPMREALESSFLAYLAKKTV